MSSRDTILRAVRQNKPAPSPAAAPVEAVRPPGELAALFARVTGEIGARLVRAEPAGVAEAIRACYPDAAVIASATPEYPDGNVDLRQTADPHDLANLDLLVCEGVLGVAESGAIWIPESRVIHRAAPFIAQHLAIIVDWENLVWDMAEAYERLRTDEEGFGVFIAGPSKTSDIEQSLVVGAHGARSVTVILLWRGEPGGMPPDDDDSEAL